MNLATLLDIPTRFTAAQYLFWTRIECLAWTAADVVIVLCLLRLANLARAHAGRAPHVFSYAVLAGTLLFLPFIVLAREGWTMFLAELAITIPHFALILYAGLRNLRLFPALLAGILEQRRVNAGEMRADGDART